MSKFLVIQDSEDEGSDNNAHYYEDGLDLLTPPFALTESDSHFLSSSLSSGPGQISGEAREKAIKEAQSLLLAPPPDTPGTPGVQPGLIKVAKAARSKTANGRLEGSISREVDVYDFPFDDEDDGDFRPSRGKKRKRLTKKSKPVTEEAEGLSYENRSRKAKPGKRRENSVMGRRAGSIPDALPDEYSEDDWTPNLRVEKPTGKKSTRSNTNEKELAPLLPKPKRKPRGGTPVSSNQFDGDLSLGVDITRVTGQDEESSTVQVGRNETSFNSFMVDLTSEDLILATQRKAEYDALSLGVTGSSNATLLPVNFVGRESDAEDYPVLSTIPDPPSDGLGQNQLWSLEHDESPAVLPHQLSPQPSPQPSLLPERRQTRMVSSPLSSPPMGPPLSEAQNETSKEGRKDDTSKIAKSSRAAKRSVTDGSLGTEGLGRVASEWRVAKGRSKTMHNVITLSDDEGHFAQEMLGKKKKVVRQRKPATVGEGAKKGAKGGDAAVKKGKGKGKAFMDDFEDEDESVLSEELSISSPNNSVADETTLLNPERAPGEGVKKGAKGGDAAAKKGKGKGDDFLDYCLDDFIDESVLSEELSISSPNNSVADEITLLNPERAPGRRRPGDQVMIAVTIESPSKPAKKRGSTTGEAGKVNPPADTVESNYDLVHEKLQRDYESAVSTPEHIVPAKRAAWAVTAAGRKKKTKQELEDEDGHWDKKPKKATKKSAAKSRNAKVGRKAPETCGKVNSKKVLDAAAIEDKTEIEAPPPKLTARGRATRARVVGKLPVEDGEEEGEEGAVERGLEEVEEASVPLKTAAKSNKKAVTTANTSKTEDKGEKSAPAEPEADTKSLGAETETTPAPPERKSSTPAPASKKASTTTPGKVPFRVGLSRKSKIPSLLKGFRK